MALTADSVVKVRWAEEVYHRITDRPSALARPLGQSADGLSPGVQFVAHFGREDRLLCPAAPIQEALPWQARHPTIFTGKH